MTDNDYSGTIIDDQYQIVRLLGEEEMGVIYLGHHVADGTNVAVKFLHTDLSDSEESIKRFFREARAAAEICHENIIQIIDVGVSSLSEPYIVMEHLVGESLSDMLDRVGRIDLSTTCTIIGPILSALDAMHAKGVVHRNIQPKNIYLVQTPNSRPIVKLIDLGLSKFNQKIDQSPLTVVGSSLGALSYISPEQMRDASNVDHHSDIYSVGTIMYEMLAGRLPFDDFAAKIADEPYNPLEVNKKFPKEAVSLVMRTLSQDPSSRPQSAKEMIDDLRNLKGNNRQRSRLNKLATGKMKITIAGSGGVVHDAGLPPEKSPLGSQGNIWHRLTGTLTGTLMGRIIGIGLILAVLVVGILVSFSGSESEKQVESGTPEEEGVAKEPVAMEPAAEIKPSDVQIEIRGLPIGAKIYYNDAPVPMNPFRVELKEVIVPLKIEADGYETYTTSLVPSEDQVVKLELKRVEPKNTAVPEAVVLDQPVEPIQTGFQDEAERQGAKSSTAPEPKSTVTKKVRHKKKRREKTKKPKSTTQYHKGKNGTRFGNEFE